MRWCSVGAWMDARAAPNWVPARRSGCGTVSGARPRCARPTGIASARRPRWRPRAARAATSGPTPTRKGDKTMTTDGRTYHCQCAGALELDCACAYDGPLSGMVVIDVIPAYLRASHLAAGNAGQWPANGADRLLVE